MVLLFVPAVWPPVAAPAGPPGPCVSADKLTKDPETLDTGKKAKLKPDEFLKTILPAEGLRCATPRPTGGPGTCVAPGVLEEKYQC